MEKSWVIALSSFLLLMYCMAFRGFKVPMTDLHGLWAYRELGAFGKVPHIIVLILGRFKGEDTWEYCHLMPVINVMASKMQVRHWV